MGYSHELYLNINTHLIHLASHVNHCYINVASFDVVDVLEGERIVQGIQFLI